MTVAPARAVTNLVHALAAAIDAADGERIEALFGSATFALAGREPREGGAAFRRVIDQGMRRYEDSPRTLHVVTNPIVDLADDARSARVQSSVMVLQAVPPDFPLQAILIGRYDDRFRPVELGDHYGGWGWAFVERRMQIDLVGDTSFHSPNRL